MARRIFLQTLAAAAILAFAPSLLLAETAFERALRVLDEPTKLEFVDTPFKDVIAYLSDQHRVPVKLLREAYEAGYIIPDQPITRNLNKVSLRSALNLVLDDLSLDYRVSDRGEILIFAAEKDARAERPISKIQIAAADRHRQLLEKQIVTLEFVDTPFKDVIAWLADDVGVTFALDAEALDAVGLQPDALVTKNLKNMPLQRALTGFLYPYDLDVELRNEVFVVTKRDPSKPRRPIPDYLKRAALKHVEIELLNPPLKDALAHCSDQADVTIVFDHRRVELARMSLDTQIIGPLPKMPLRDALHKLLHPLGLRAIVIDEVLFITTLANAKEEK